MRIDNKKIVNLLYSIDEELGAIATLFLVVYFIRDAVVAVILAGVVYGLLSILTQEEPEPVLKEEPEPVVVEEGKVVSKPNKLGDVYLNDTFKINLLGKNIFLAAITRFGKTSLLNLFILAIHKQYTQEQVELFVIDLKRVSFGILNKSPLVKNKVYLSSKGVEVLHDELERRTNLFVKMTEDTNKIVADIKKYNKVRGTNPKMLPMIVIVDEIQKLDKAHGEMMANIVRTGLAMGINVIATSQRTTSESVSTSALQQYDIRFIGKMKNGKEYGYANVDKAIAQAMLSAQKPGRFACEVDNGWTIQQTDFVSDTQLEKLSNTWEDAVVELSDSLLERNAEITKWMRTLDRKPTIATVKKRYNTRKDVANGILLLWKRRNI